MSVRLEWPKYGQYRLILYILEIKWDIWSHTPAIFITSIVPDRSLEFKALKYFSDC